MAGVFGFFLLTFYLFNGSHMFFKKLFHIFKNLFILNNVQNSSEDLKFHFSLKHLIILSGVLVLPTSTSTNV